MTCTNDNKNNSTKNNATKQEKDYIIHYSITGSAAHGRIKRLLPSHWVDLSPYARNDDNNTNTSSSQAKSNNQEEEDSDNEEKKRINFLWENAPRHETKSYRDEVCCYSHLPSGIFIMDDKWILARLLSSSPPTPATHATTTTTLLENQKKKKNGEEYYLATLESHCFRGSSGFRDFCANVGMFDSKTYSNILSSYDDETNYQFPDLISNSSDKESTSSSSPPPEPSNLWVIKDAQSNGAGGIWIVNPSNALSFLPSSSSSSSSSQKNNATTTPLIENHRYVAQRYVWPPVLYRKKKCHVRVYAFVTSTGSAFVHKRAFLHVANEDFTYAEQEQEKQKQDDDEKVIFDPSVHISNCCANSHDASKFAGEICADFELPPSSSSFSTTTTTTSSSSGKEKEIPIVVVSLQEFFPSVKASIAKLAQKSLPFLRGGEANNGFEYLGIDFMLSYKYDDNDNNDEGRKKKKKVPIAYMLEVNAPPSQDTATGLNHAEELHDEVLSDLMKFWVIPRVEKKKNKSTATSELDDCKAGGWRCVYNENEASTNNDDDDDNNNTDNLIVPSKAAILNKVRWAMYERKMSRAYEDHWANNTKKEKNHGAIDDANDGNLTACENKKNVISGDDDDDDKVVSVTTTSDSIAKFARRHFPFFLNIDNNRFIKSQRESSSASSSTTTHSQQSNHHHDHHPTIFFENAGGAQVPTTVLRSMNRSLIHRDRCRIGASYKSQARKTLYTLLGGTPRNHFMFLGCNATSLLRDLSKQYCGGFVKSGDEIIVRTENHMANVAPWVEVAKRIDGVAIRWWTTNMCNIDNDEERKNKVCSRKLSTSTEVPLSSSANLKDLITSKTRIVAISHASNILGKVRNIESICREIKHLTGGRAHVIVDGVAAAPHLFSDVDRSGVDFYVVSCHKLFGPHLGGLCARKSAVWELMGSEKSKNNDGSTTGNNEENAKTINDKSVYQSWEVGTLDYDGCSGVVGLGEYFSALAAFDPTKVCSVSGRQFNTVQPMTQTNDDNQQQRQTSNQCTEESRCDREEEHASNRAPYEGMLHPSLMLQPSKPQETLKSEQVMEAYKLISTVECSLMNYLLTKFRTYSLVRIIDEKTCLDDAHQVQQQGQRQLLDVEQKRLPILSFVHDEIKPSDIVSICYENDIACRHGTFLSTEMFMEESCIRTKSPGVDDVILNSNSSDQHTVVVSKTEENEGLVRLSLAHYNTKEEIDMLLRVLESIENWC